jgi:cytochrome c biogenesis protein CcdA
MAPLRLAAVAFSVGLADSVNPSTVGPALYLATGTSRVARVTAFTAGVFTVNLVAGVLLAVGPGRLLVELFPHPRPVVTHVLELVAGLALIAAALALWLARRRLAARELAMRGGGRRSALIAGASIAAIELPTAAPYLGVIALTAASTASAAQTVGLLALFNAGFVLPLLAIIAVLLVAGDRADPLLDRWGQWLRRRWPLVLGGLFLLAGAGLAVAGAVGLLTQ